MKLHNQVANSGIYDLRGTVDELSESPKLSILPSATKNVPFRERKFTQLFQFTAYFVDYSEDRLIRGIGKV